MVSGTNSGIREVIGFAMARTLPQTDSVIWALGKCSCGWHFASIPVSATVGFMWSMELNPGLNIRGLWEGFDWGGIQIKARYPLRADSVYLSVSPSLTDVPSLFLAMKSRHSGAAKEMAEVQGQYWYPDFSKACQHALTVTPAVCCWTRTTLKRKQWQPWWQRQPTQNCCQWARKPSWGQIHHSNSRNQFSFRDYGIMQLIIFSFEKVIFQTFLSVCAMS